MCEGAWELEPSRLKLLFYGHMFCVRPDSNCCRDSLREEGQNKDFDTIDFYPALASPSKTKKHSFSYNILLFGEVLRDQLLLTWVRTKPRGLKRVHHPQYNTRKNK